MSTKEKEDVVVSNVPPNPHIEAALARVLELRKWRQEIPHFTIPATADATRRMINAASVPPEFVEQTNLAMTSQPSLARHDAIPPAQLRELAAYADAYEPLADELEAMAQFVRHSVTAARNTIGTEALTTYAFAQRLAKVPRTAHLKPYVADMRRALGRVRKLTPEQAAKKATERAARAAARLVKSKLEAKPAPDANDPSRQSS